MNVCCFSQCRMGVSGLFTPLLGKIMSCASASRVLLLFPGPRGFSVGNNPEQLLLVDLYSITDDCCCLSSDSCDFHNGEFYVERWILECLQQRHNAVTKTRFPFFSGLLPDWWSANFASQGPLTLRQIVGDLTNAFVCMPSVRWHLLHEKLETFKIVYFKITKIPC